MMKKIYKQLCVTVVLCLLVCTGAFASDVEPWAEDAVNFAVEEGLMDGENIRPLDNATRAELSTMLVRLFGQEAEADLSDYTDVSQEDWYYDYVSKAVAMGVLSGVGDTLQPMEPVTREAAMVMLARGFGIYGTEDDVLDIFSDGATVSTWARPYLAALVDGGYVNGESGTVLPQNYMTRQELAYLLYVCAQDYTILRDKDSTPTGTFEGNIIIGGDWDVEELNRTKIQGDLVLHGGTQLTLSGISTVETILTTGADVMLNTRGIENLVVLSGHTTVDGGLYDLYCVGDVTIADGTVARAVVDGKTLIVEEDAKVKSVQLIGKNSVVDGKGTVTNAEILKADCQVLTEKTNITENIDYGILDIVLTATVPVQELSPEDTLVSTTIQFTNVPVEKSVTLQWYLDGALQKTERSVTISEGSTRSFSVNIPYTEDLEESKTVTLYVQYDDEVIGLSQTVDTRLDLSPYYVSIVETLEVLATVSWTTNVYSSMYLSGTVLATVYPGDVVVYDDYYGTYSGRVVLDDGTVGWVSRSAIQISTADFVQYTDYTATEKLKFINQNGYTSTTPYLVWISLKTQKVNVFMGEPGNWQLLQEFSVCTGKNTTPTEAGVFSYLYYGGTWDFGSYYVKNAMIFNGGHAFHSRTYIKSTGGLLDPTIGTPASAGCIRMYDADVEWLVKYLPLGSTVVVY